VVVEAEIGASTLTLVVDLFSTLTFCFTFGNTR